MLFSWIGSADLAAMANDQSAGDKEEIHRAIKWGRDDAKGTGPLRSVLENEQFGEIHLLGNYAEKHLNQYASWLDSLNLNITTHAVKLVSPIDYDSIYTNVKQILDKHYRSAKNPTFYLTPGTPAMAATWLLLGKSLYPARLIQGYEGKQAEVVVPFDIRADVISKVLEQSDLLWAHLSISSPQEVSGFHRIVGDSTAIREAVGRAQRIAIRDTCVMVVGETGTGKELFAQAIHAASPRNKGEFIAINCAALSKELLESELFGHVKDAFTGAARARKGAFERAHNGTLFLDEIGECSLDMQAKLLRALQPTPGSKSTDRTFTKVGADKETTVNVRVIAATNRNLDQRVQEGYFREDLLYRLAVINLRLPPLRERGKDITLIAESILMSINNEFREVEPGYSDKTISAEAIYLLEQQKWSGNVRALSNCLMQSAIMARADILEVSDIQAALKESPRTNTKPTTIGNDFCLKSHLKGIQTEYLTEAVKQSNGTKTDAAGLVGYSNYQRLDAQLATAGLTFEEIWESR